jgi:DNA-binding response OmpR family regulator
MVIVDLGKYLVSVGGKQKKLTPKEFKVLAQLIRLEGVVVEREYILAECFDINAKIDTRTVDQHVSRLRSKIGTQYIRTVPGVGYAFEGKATVIPKPAFNNPA